MAKMPTLRKAHSTNTQKWLKTLNTKWLQMKVNLSTLHTAILELVLPLILARLHI